MPLAVKSDAHLYPHHSDEPQRPLAQRGKPSSKDHMLCDSICLTFSKWEHYRDSGHISGCQGLAVAGWAGMTIEGYTWGDCGGRWDLVLCPLQWWLPEHTQREDNPEPHTLDHSQSPSLDSALNCQLPPLRGMGKGYTGPSSLSSQLPMNPLLIEINCLNFS